MDIESITPSPNSTGRILVVEDSISLGRVVKKAVELISGLPVDLAPSYAESMRFLANHAAAYRVAIVDLNLPDAPNGEAVDLLLGHSITTVVLTGSLDIALRDRILAKPVADYVVKQHPGSIDAVQRAIRRLLRNEGRHVLLVHQPGALRDHIANFMATQKLTVIQLNEASEAINLLQSDRSISLVICEEAPPEQDGIALTAMIRARFSPSEVAILGISDFADDPFIGVQFLKAGADDLVRKPFLNEEFAGRINNCLDHIDSIQLVQEQANRDHLSKLHNRRYFFEVSKTLYSSAQREQIRLTAAMIDIDHFKKINDTYGHDIGDKVIVAVAKVLQATFRGSDVVARMGGEEFCVLAVNADNPAAVFNRLREGIAGTAIETGIGDTIQITVSIGLSTQLGNNIDDLVKSSDTALYAAKTGGRNRVVWASAETG